MEPSPAVEEHEISGYTELMSTLSTNLQGAEFSFAAFSSAIFSYKCDSLLKPFPPMYVSSNGEKDITSLRKAASSFPCLQSVSEGQASLSSSQSDLLLWIIKSYRTSLHFIDLSRLDSLRELTKEHIPLPTPQLLYELKYSDQSESAFQGKCAERKIIHAYHGSRPENFYSILHHGLHAHMNKTSLYGEGTYLSVEPTVAMGFSPSGPTGWPNSANIGDSISVVALCEVIDDPSVKHNSTMDGAANTAARAPNSMGGDVPDKYIVVTNNDMVRVKYLFVYSKKTASSQSTTPHIRSGVTDTGSRQSPFVQWLHRHGNVIPMTFYMILLIFIGLMSSKRFWTRIKQICEETFDSFDWTGSSSL